MSKSDKSETTYEGFTLSLALVDALPVLFFGASCILIGMLFGSALFTIGACLCFAGGFLKVMWKIILATSKKDIVPLNKQFRCTMPAGFVLIAASLIIDRRKISFPGMLAAVCGMPQAIFFALWSAGMVAMTVLAKKLDSSVAKNNWIEQGVNGIAQLCLLIALLMII